MRSGAAAVFGLALGVVLGWGSERWPPPEHHVASARSDPSNSAHPPSRRFWTRSSESIEACEAEIQAVLAREASTNTLMELELATVRGIPMEWPVDLPQEYAAEGVHRTIQRTRESCPDAAGLRFFTDCSEFPCLVWVRSVGKTASSVLANCDAFGFVSGGWEHIAGSRRTDPERYVTMWSYDMLPSYSWVANEDRVAYEKRQDFRRDALRSIVLDEWSSQPDTGADTGAD